MVGFCSRSSPISEVLSSTCGQRSTCWLPKTGRSRSLRRSDKKSYVIWESSVGILLGFTKSKDWPNKNAETSRNFSGAPRRRRRAGEACEALWWCRAVEGARHDVFHWTRDTEITLRWHQLSSWHPGFINLIFAVNFQQFWRESETEHGSTSVVLLRSE